MGETRYKVQVEGDHLKKLANAKPIPAVAELIWNAVDADATRVDIEIDSNDMGMQAICVRDNGHGIPHEDIPALFGKLGGSWKSHGRTSKTGGRILHGKEGKGRFQALALGRVADWTVRYRDSGGGLLGYRITILRDDIVDVRVSEAAPVDAALGTGVEVWITELDRVYRSLEPDQAVQPLSEIFALYLTDYTDVDVFVEGERLDPSAAILDRVLLPLAPILGDGEGRAAELELIEWRSSAERWFFLCGAAGFPFSRITPRFQAPGHQFSAYLKSSYVDLLQEQGVLALSEMSPPLEKAYEEAAEAIKAHFKKRDAEAARSEIDRWKAEDSYPYREEPETAVEQAERQVFDILALNLNRHMPDFTEQSRQSRAFQLRMLRQALERGSDELQHIFTEVLQLPERAQKQLSKLLEEADLANIISASNMVADRLKFVHGLEALLFDTDTKKHLKERSQLHRMIAEHNTWIFGEEFNLTVDDQSLTEVLRKHKALIGDDTVIDQPVKRVDGKVGIVDLMLSRTVPQNHADEHEHLVVELKRPAINVGSKEIQQVKDYAFAVADDERFRDIHTRWSFWVISNDLDASARREVRQKDKPHGLVYESEDGSIKVWVKTWSAVIAECKARLRFVQDRLNAKVDKDRSLSYLKQTYGKYLSGVTAMDIEDSASDEEEAVSAAEAAE